MPTHSLQNVTRRLSVLGILLTLIVVAGALVWLTAEHLDRRVDTKRNEFSSQTKSGVFYPTAEQWATLTVEPVQQRVFQSEHVTEGKIVVDEDRSTPIFSPYAGRVLKLFVKPGDTVSVAAVVHGPSRRHGAGAERFHFGRHRAQQGALGTQLGADHR